MRSVFFIVNPAAGKGKGYRTVKQIKQHMKNYKVPYKIQLTSKEKEAEELAKIAAAEGYGKIVAVGGDGTIYEVLNGMIGSDALLGVIPAGTGNDFARTLGISQNVEEALHTVVYGKEKWIDCGKANGRYFMNVASIGLDAEIAKETERIKKFISGTWAYIIGVLKTLIYFKHKKVNINIDGQETVKEIMLVAIANGQYYGGGMRIAPGADIKDGYFDVCIIHKISKGKILRLFPMVFTGRHISIQEVQVYKAREINIASDKVILLNLDGEIVGNTPVNIKIISKALRVLIP